MYKGPLSQAKLCGRNNDRFHTYSWDSSVEAVSRLGLTYMRNLTRVSRKDPIAVGYVGWRFRFTEAGFLFHSPTQPPSSFPFPNKRRAAQERPRAIKSCSRAATERPRAIKTDTWKTTLPKIERTTLPKTIGRRRNQNSESLARSLIWIPKIDLKVYQLAYDLRQGFIFFFFEPGIDYPWTQGLTIPNMKLLIHRNSIAPSLRT